MSSSSIPKKLYEISLFLISIVILIISILTFIYPSLGKVGMVFLYISFIPLLIFIIRSLAIFWEVGRKKYFIAIISLLLILFTTLINTTSVKNLSGEATQEISCILTNIKNSEDFGYNKTCLFGYPARQFYIPALPTILFGRSQLALNLGMSIYFLLGSVIFSAGVLKFFNKSFLSSLICGILIAFLYHVSSFNFLLYNYEQSLFPISFSLILSGLFLLRDENNFFEILGLILLVLNFVIYSYTPSLSLFFLAIGVLTYLFFKSQLTDKKSRVILLVIFLAATTFVVSLFSRQDIVLFTALDKQDVIADLFKAFNHLIFQTEGVALVSPIFQMIFLLIIFAAIVGGLGLEMFLVAAWIIAVMIFSIVAKGYSYYGIDYRFYRISLIFPIIFIMLIGLIRKHFHHVENRHYVVIVIFLFFFATGFFYQTKYLSSKNDNQHLIFFNWLKSIHQEKLLKEKVNIYINSTSPSILLSLNDSFRYFYPNARSYIEDLDCSNMLNDNSSKKYLLRSATEKVEPCEEIIISKASKIGEFSVDGATQLIFYNLN